MNEDISIIVKTLLDGKGSDLDGQVKKLSAQIKEQITLKLKIDTNDLQVINSQIEKVSKQIQQGKVVKGSTFINMDAEKVAFSDLTARIKDIRSNVDQLAKIKINTNANNGIDSATLTYYNKELVKTVTETMKWVETQSMVNNELVSVQRFGTTGFAYSDDIAKASKNAEKLAENMSKVNNSLNAQKQAVSTRDFNYGKVIEGVNATAFSNADSFKNYIKQTYGDTADLIGKFNDKQLKSGEIISQANFRVKEGADKWRLYQATLNKTTGEMRLMDNGLKDVINRQMSFGAMLKNAFEKFSIWSIATVTWFAVINTAKEMVKTVIELDTAITNLKKVSDELGKTTSVKTFLTDMNNLAIDVGHSTKSAIEAVTEFKKLGNSLADSQALAQTSLIYSNVGDVNIGDSTQSIISTMQAFNIEASKSISIVDKFNEVNILPIIAYELLCA